MLHVGEHLIACQMGNQRLPQLLHPQRISVGEELGLVGIDRFVEAVLEIEIGKQADIRRRRRKIDGIAFCACPRRGGMSDHIKPALRHGVNRMPLFQLRVGLDDRAGAAIVFLGGLAHRRKLLSRAISACGYFPFDVGQDGHVLFSRFCSPFPLILPD